MAPAVSLFGGLNALSGLSPTPSPFAQCSGSALSVVPHAQLAYSSLYLECSFPGLLYFFLLCFMQASKNFASSEKLP